MAALDRLLRPRSIAVVGGKPAREVARQNERLGFDGAVWVVHPAGPYCTVADLPAAPDAVFLAVNRHATVGLVGQLAAAGAGGAVCYAAGFAEAGAEGATLQAGLRAAAGAMPVLGPNCYGFLNYFDGAALWPDQHGGARVARGVAIVTQSGNIGLNLTMQRRGLPLGYLVTLGNQAVVGLSDAIAALAEDSRVSAIGLHVEALDDAAAFAAAVAGAAARGVPVVALKTGASATGAALALSHTASLAAGDAVLDAYFARIGVARVATLPALLEALKLLHFHGRLEGRDVVSLSCSGGEAALFADRAEGAGVRFRPFSAVERAAVAATVPALVTVSNPFDYHTFHWADRAAMAATFTAVLRCGFALALLVLDFPREDRGDAGDWWLAALALADACAATGQPAAVVATLPECLPEARAEALAAIGLVPLCGLDEALAACAAAAAAPPGDMPLLGPTRAGPARLLDEHEAKRLLAAHGVTVPPGTRDEVVGWTHFPAAAKALGVAHKTEHGAVRLHLADAAALDEAVRALTPLGDGVLVEAMVEGGVAELIVGVARDAAIGPYLLLGSGGVLAELVADRALLMLPAGEAAIRTALAGLRVARLLDGFRRRPPGDVGAAVTAILAIQDFALAHIDRLLELDVNPLIVTPTSAVAADALIRLVELI